MALDLHIKVIDTETDNLTDIFTTSSLTPKELGMVNMLIEAIQFGGEIILVDNLDTVRG